MGDAPAREPPGRFPRRFVIVGVALACLAVFRLVADALIWPKPDLWFSAVLWTPLVASGVGVSVRRYWARLLALVLCFLVILGQVLIFSGAGGFPVEALHWSEKLFGVGQILLAAASILVLATGDAGVAFVGNRKVARWVIGAAVVVGLALVLFAFLRVEDERLPDARAGGGTSTTER